MKSGTLDQEFYQGACASEIKGFGSELMFSHFFSGERLIDFLSAGHECLTIRFLGLFLQALI